MPFDELYGSPGSIPRFERAGASRGEPSHGTLRLYSLAPHAIRLFRHGFGVYGVRMQAEIVGDSVS